MFGFGRKKKQRELLERRERACQELTEEIEALRTELELLSKKLNVELSTGDGDRSTTLSRYPRRIVELKITIDELERKRAVLGGG